MLKTMIFRFAIVCLLTGCKAPSLECGTVVDCNTVQDIRTALPAGWKLDLPDGKLWIEKENLVHALFIVPNMSGIEKAGPMTYWFELKLTDFIAPETYEALQLHNSELRSLAERLYQDTQIIRIPHEGGKVPPWLFEYQPRTEEESKNVTKYKKLYAEIKELPDLYKNGQSFFLSWNSVSFDRKLEEEECQKVKAEVLSLFTRYENGSNNRMASIR